MKISSNESRTIEGKYKLLRQEGKGAFGEVYSGVDLKTGKNIAIKFESIKGKVSGQIINEANIYKALKGGVGIPKFYSYGVEGDRRYIVLELLGPSLEDLHHFCKRKFSVISTAVIGQQMINLIEFVHSRGIIHRDIKPNNYSIGRKDKSNMIYMLDFGLSKYYCDPRNKVHIPYRDGKRMTGTGRYASINNHMGIEQTRRDDMESIAYTLIYLLKGKLPWQGVKGENKMEKYEKIMEMKMSTTLEILCKDIPNEMREFLRYCRYIRYEEDPDYHKIKRSFDNILHNLNLSKFDFDWNLLNSQKTSIKPRASSTACSRDLLKKRHNLELKVINKSIKTPIKQQSNPQIENFEENFDEMISENCNEKDIDKIEIDIIPNERFVPSKISIPHQINLKNYLHFVKHKQNINHIYYDTIN